MKYSDGQAGYTIYVPESSVSCFEPGALAPGTGSARSSIGQAL